MKYHHRIRANIPTKHVSAHSNELSMKQRIDLPSTHTTYTSWTVVLPEFFCITVKIKQLLPMTVKIIDFVSDCWMKNNLLCMYFSVLQMYYYL